MKTLMLQIEALAITSLLYEPEEWKTHAIDSNSSVDTIGNMDTLGLKLKLYCDSQWKGKPIDVYLEILILQKILVVKIVIGE